MIYQIPEDPRTPVWDKNQQEWEPDRPGYYGRKFGSIRRIITWADLIVRHGPLTDTKIPEVGETVPVLSGDALSAKDVPEDAVFINGKVSAVRVGNFFNFSGDIDACDSLYPGDWTRLR
ncbi:hypothetical protein [Trueperella pyogenes]|uniref:hypothetical protein n=1 Tax=Trueperella pyogenes TaxID=1661 RepID=UPI0024C0DEBC|nr:hypothetical protein [Trueperella pyogenes]WHU57067.1 hypothetical protein QEV10_10105 [Trueperella pyogenes]